MNVHERLDAYGPETLATEDLVAVVTNRPVGTEPDAAEHDAATLAGLRPAEMSTLLSISPTAAANLAAGIEIGRRTRMYRSPPKGVHDPSAVAALAEQAIGCRREEHFGLMTLTSKHGLIALDIISTGMIDTAPAHPRAIFAKAMARNAAAVALFHNHPSGDPTPSANDVRITQLIIDAGKLLAIPVLDHVVVTGTRWSSMRTDVEELVWKD